MFLGFNLCFVVAILAFVTRGFFRQFFGKLCKFFSYLLVTPDLRCKYIDDRSWLSCKSTSEFRSWKYRQIINLKWRYSSQASSEFSCCDNFQMDFYILPFLLLHLTKEKWLSKVESVFLKVPWICGTRTNLPLLIHCRNEKTLGYRMR